MTASAVRDGDDADRVAVGGGETDRESQRKSVKRDARGRVLPGQRLLDEVSPGYKPPGRPRGFAGLAREIQARTDGGRELIDFALRTFRDEELPLSWRWAALELLLDRGYGKAMQPVELQASIVREEGVQKGRLPVERFTKEELEWWDRLTAKLVGDGGSSTANGGETIKAKLLTSEPVVEVEGEAVQVEQQAVPDEDVEDRTSDE